MPAPKKGRKAVAADVAKEPDQAPRNYGALKGRQVTEVDTDIVGKKLGLKKRDMIWFFGQSAMDRRMARRFKDSPVTDPAMGALVRFLDKFPERCPVPPLLQAKDFYDYVNKFAPLDLRHFALMMCRESSAGYRWNQKNGQIGPLIKHIIWMMWNAMQAVDTDEERIQIWNDWKQCVLEEAESRGITDLANAVSWPKENKKDRRELYDMERERALAGKGEDEDEEEQSLFEDDD